MNNKIKNWWLRTKAWLQSPMPSMSRGASLVAALVLVVGMYLVVDPFGRVSFSEATLRQRAIVEHNLALLEDKYYSSHYVGTRAIVGLLYREYVLVYSDVWEGRKPPDFVLRFLKEHSNDTPQFWDESLKEYIPNMRSNLIQYKD